ncbi:hypothetical protein HBA92_12490 [Ochrobactrum sp. MR28]|nr:hypothetical protein [Ochrobactrum sp. MR28]MBX8816691.1 hypothetical protein [Ochrobactrum sp. MR31]
MTNSSLNSYAIPNHTKITDWLENTIDALKAFDFMLHETMNTGVSFQHACAGVSLLLSQQLADLSDIRTAAINEFDTLTRKAEQKTSRRLISVDEDVLKHISCMVKAARDDQNEKTVNEDETSLILKYYGMLLNKLGDKDELLMVGSLFPWLEMQIKKDFGLVSNDEKNETRRLIQQPLLDKDVIVHISNMIMSAYRATDVDVDDYETAVQIPATAVRYYHRLLEKLDGEDDLLIVGSMFPWLEMKIRKDLGASISELTDKEALPREEGWAAPRSLRDEFIAEKLKQGFSVQYISQALNIRVSAIEKAMTKLAEKDQQSGESAAA